MPIHLPETITTRQDNVSEYSDATSNVLARARARDHFIWIPNKYAKLAESNSRNVILGLYSASNENSYSYLVEISAIDLENLFYDFLAEIKRIDADNTILLTELNVKEQLAEIDNLIFRDKLATQAEKNAYLAEYYQARIDALDVDEKQLATKEKEILLLQEQVNLKIQELLNQTEEEGLKQSMVDVDIARKELDLVRTQQQYVKVGLEVLDYQKRLNETSAKIAEIDIEIITLQARYFRLIADSSSKEAALRKLDVRLAELNADLIYEGVRIVRLDNDYLKLVNAGMDIDMDLLRETVKSIKLQSSAFRLVAEKAKLLARGSNLDADTKELDARSDHMDAMIERINTSLVEEGVKLIRMENKIKDIENDIEKLELISIDKDISDIRKDNQDYEAYDIHSKRMELLYAELAGVKMDEDYYEELLDALTRLLAARKRGVFEGFASSLTSLANSHITSEQVLAQDIGHSDDNKAVQTDNEIPTYEYIDGEHRSLFSIPVQREIAKGDNLIDKQESLAEADVVNSLIHVLGSE